jgi:hypothetical protein
LPVVAVVNVNTSGEGRVAGGCRPGGRYSVTNYPLRALIAAAYLRPQINPDFLIAGGPDWIDKARFNVEGNAAGEFPPGPDGPNAPRPVMLQRLLADRFGLRVHHETRDGTCVPRIAPGSLTLPGTSLTTLVNLLTTVRLGLRLQAQTGRVDVLVIDATTWPTGN